MSLIRADVSKYAISGAARRRGRIPAQVTEVAGALQWAAWAGSAPARAHGHADRQADLHRLRAKAGQLACHASSRPPRHLGRHGVRTDSADRATHGHQPRASAMTYVASFG